MTDAKQIEPYMNPTFPPSVGYGGLGRQGRVNEVTKGVRT